MIPITRPWIDERELEAIRAPLESGWVTQGPEVAAFESEFAAFVGASHACAVSNGTSALLLALQAVGVGPGDEVITVSHSFIATANAVRHLGATPVFVDLEPGTFNMSPVLTERAVGPKTAAILCVHQVGMPCDLAALEDVAAKAGVPLVEDAACAIGSEIEIDGEWRRIGAPHGAAACFSFHPRKLLTTGDGGMITTNDPGLDAHFRSHRHHGIALPPVAGGPPAYAELGFNYRMTDIQGAMGRVQLAKIPEMVAGRRRQVARYRELLDALPGVVPASEPAWARSNWQTFFVKLPDGVGQKATLASMRGRGVGTGPGVLCAHREPVYQTEPWRCLRPEGAECQCAQGTCSELSESEAAQDRWIILPLYHAMSDGEQQKVVETLGEALKEQG